MLLIDTSVWINLFRDKSGVVKTRLQNYLGNKSYSLPVFTQMELLQGCKNETEWQKLNQYLAVQSYIIPNYETIWVETARLYFELRRKGITVRSNIDCAIAICAIQDNLTLYHCEGDFEQIARVTTLKQKKLIF
jgi:predicted nucleic acid-binding protein